MNLRPMTFDDADFLLELKNYPETRHFSIVSQDEIKREDHLNFLKENLKYFQIIESPNIKIQDGDEQYPVPVGAIRIKDKEISIWLDRKYWGNKIASYVLEMVSRKGMIARIVNGNISSMRAFINAGFKPIDYHKEEINHLTNSIQSGYYIFQK